MPSEPTVTWKVVHVSQNDMNVVFHLLLYTTDNGKLKACSSLINDCHSTNTAASGVANLMIT